MGLTSKIPPWGLCLVITSLLHKPKAIFAHAQDANTCTSGGGVYRRMQVLWHLERQLCLETCHLSLLKHHLSSEGRPLQTPLKYNGFYLILYCAWKGTCTGTGVNFGCINKSLYNLNMIIIIYKWQYFLLYSVLVDQVVRRSTLRSHGTVTLTHPVTTH